MPIIGLIFSFILSPFKILLNLFLSLPLKIQLIIISVIATFLLLQYYKHTIIKECEIKQELFNAKQVEKYNEIATQRPDTNILIKLLRTGNF